MSVFDALNDIIGDKKKRKKRQRSSLGLGNLNKKGGGLVPDISITDGQYGKSLTDIDGDGVPNITDCRPLNPHKHKYPKGDGKEIRLAIIVPSTQGDKEINQATFRKRVKRVERFLDKTFGGSTKVSGHGTWVEGGKVIAEKVAVVECYTDRDVYRKHENDIKRFIQRIKRDWDQQTISYHYEDLVKHTSNEGLHFL